MKTNLLILESVLTWGVFITLGLISLALDIYISRKYLDELNKKNNFLQSLTNRIVFFECSKDDGLWLKIQYLNKVGAVIRKKNMGKIYKNLDAKLVKLLIISNWVDLLSCIFIALSFAGTFYSL